MAYMVDTRFRTVQPGVTNTSDRTANNNAIKAAYAARSASMQQLAKSSYKASGKSYTPPKPDPSPAPSPSPDKNSGGGSNNNTDQGPTSSSSGYQSTSQDDYYKALVKSKKNAINAEYETNASIIKNNLTRALAALNQSKAALEPLYQRQLGSIAQNQFNTSETTKEIMNQGGWNASNSGLAVGEQTKISNAADKQRGDALQAKTTAENEYNSQMAAEQMAADESLGALGKWRSAQLSAAEADALVTSTNYGRAIYESDRDFAFTQRQFEESVRQFEVQLEESRANRTAAEKAAVAKSTNDGTAQTEYNKYLGALYSPAVTSPDVAYDLLSTALSDETLSDQMKEDMIAQYNKWGTAWNIKNSESGQQYTPYDFSQMNQ